MANNFIKRFITSVVGALVDGKKSKVDRAMEADPQLRRITAKLHADISEFDRLLTAYHRKHPNEKATFDAIQKLGR